MRAGWTVLLAAVMLSGCGVKAPVTGAYANHGPLLAQSRAGAYHAVFHAEPNGWQAVEKAAGQFVIAHEVALPMKAYPVDNKGRVERVRQVSAHTLAARTVGSRREFVGEMEFIGTTVPSTFSTYKTTLPFRMTLSASGELVKFEYEHVSLDGAKIVEPEFRSVSAKRAAEVEQEVLAFIREQNPDGDNLQTALIGKSTRFTAEIAQVKDTRGAFGELGTVSEIKVPLKHADGPLFYTYTLHVLRDKAGRVTALD